MSDVAAPGSAHVASHEASLVSTPDSLRVYVNERGVSVPHGSVALDAVRALFPDLAVEVSGGTQRLTDSRGLPVDATQPLVGGSIYRVVPVRERPESVEDTTHGAIAMSDEAQS